MTTYVFVVSGTSVALPGDFNQSNNTIGCIGGGQGGQAANFGSSGGTGAYYCDVSNDPASGTVSCTIGAAGATNRGNGGNTTWRTNVVVAPGGGQATSPVGTNQNAGGAGGTNNGTNDGGGGGAGGPNGAGKAGGRGGGTSGGGGGGAGGASSTAGSVGVSSTGGKGGDAQDGTAGPSGTTAAGSAGSHGSGGAGSGNTTPGTGGAGGNGIEWDSTHGAGGGGGGGSGSLIYNGGKGGNYGGGGGAGASSTTNQTGGPGIIAIGYVPLVANQKTITGSLAPSALQRRGVNAIRRATASILASLVTSVTTASGYNAFSVVATATLGSAESVTKAISKSITAGIQNLSAAAIKAVGKPLATSVAVVANLRNSIGKILTADPVAMLASVSVLNSYRRVLTATQGSVSTLQRAIAKLIVGTRASSATLIRSKTALPLPYSASLAPSTALVLSTKKPLFSSVSPLALLVAQKAAWLRLTGTFPTTATLPRAISKAIASVFGAPITLTSIGAAATSASAPLALDGVAHGSFANPVTCSLTTTNANDIIIVAIATYVGAAGPAPTITSVTASGLTFTRREQTGANSMGANVSGNFELWWAVATSPLSAKTISASISSGASDIAMIAFGISGADTSSPFDSNGSLPKANITTTGGVPSASSVSTTNLNDFLFSVAFMFVGAGKNFPGTGYTDITNFNSNGNAIAFDAMYKIVSAAQSNVTVSWGASEGGGSFGNICYVDAVKQGFTSPVVASISGVTVPVGSTILVLASSSGTGGTLTISDTAGNVYSPVSGGSVKYGTLYYCRNCLALAGGSIQVSGSAADDVSIQACYTTGLLSQSDPLDLATAGASGTGTTLSSTSAAPAVPGELFIAASSFSAAATVFTQASGWTACSSASSTETSTGSGINQTQQWGYILGGAGAQTYNPTINVSEAWNVPVLASFKPQTSLYGWSTRGIVRPLIVTPLALAASIFRRTAKISTAAVSVAATAFQMLSYLRVLSAQVGSLVTLPRAMSKTLALSRASVATVIRAVSKAPFTLSMAVVSSLRNQVGKPLIVDAVSVAATLSQFRAFIRILSAQVASSVSIARTISKILTGTYSSPLQVVNIGGASQLNGGVSGSGTVTLSGVNVPNGALILLNVAASSFSATYTISDSAGNTYSLIGGSIEYGLLYRCNNCLPIVNGTIQANNANAVTNGDDISLQACYVSGLLASADPLDLQTSQTSGTSTAPSNTSGTPAVSGELFIATVSHSGVAGVYNESNSWTTIGTNNITLTSVGSGTSQAHRWAYLVANSAGARTFAPSLNNSVPWVCPNLISLKPQVDSIAVRLFRGVVKPAFTVTIPLSASIVKTVAKLLLADAVAVAASLLPVKAYNRIFSATISPVVSMQRAMSKVVTRAQGSTATLLRSISKAFVLSVSVPATLLKTTAKVLATSVTAVATSVVRRSGIISLSSAVATAGSLLRSSGKILRPSVGQTATLRRSIGHILSAGLDSAASRVLSVGRVMRATVAVTASSSVLRAFNRVLRGTQATLASLFTNQGFVLAGTQPVSATLRRQQKKVLIGGLAPILTLRANLFRSVTLRASQASSLTIIRAIGKIVRIGLTNAANTLLRHVRDTSGSTEPALIRAGNNVFLITIQGHDGTTVQTLRFSSDGIMTRPSDTPSNTYFEPRVVDPGNFERHLFSQGTTRGQVSVGEGDVILASGDSGRSGDTLDYLLGWAFDGYRIVIQSLTSVRQAVVLAKTLFTGSIEQIVTDDAYNQISFKIHDRLSDLSLPLLTATFGGTTTAGSMGTADGNADLAGQKIQQVFGTAFNVSPQVSNAYDLVYLFSGGALHSLDVKDGGVSLTNDGDVANLAALLAWTQVPGHYKTCLAIGSARLGGSPAFGITADVVEGASSANRTAAQIAKRMMLAFGISSGDIDAATVTALDSANSAECGIVVTGDATCLDSVAAVIDSIGGYIVPNNVGVFQFGRFEAPSGTPVIELDEDTIIGQSLQRIATGDDGRGIPTWRVTINYGQNWTIQKDTQLAGTVTDAQRLFLSSQWRTAADSDSSVQTRHKKAVDVTINSCLAYESDAAAEATRLLSLHKVRRDAYRVGATLDYGSDADIGSVIRLTSQSDRFGLGSGQLFTVIGRVDDYENKLVELDVWG